MTKEGTILVTLMSVTMALVVIALIYFRCRYTAQKERIDHYLSVARERMETQCNDLSTACMHMESDTSRMAIAISVSLRDTIKEEFVGLKSEIGTGLDQCYSLMEQRLRNDDDQAPLLLHS